MFYETLLPCRICGGTIETCRHTYSMRRKYEDELARDPEAEDDYPFTRTNPFGERD